jgi:hypothetical protein
MRSFGVFDAEAIAEMSEALDAAGEPVWCGNASPHKSLPGETARLWGLDAKME